MMSNKQQNPVLKRHLSVPLTQEEVLKAGEDLARRHADLGCLEDQLKSVKEDFKNRITQAETDINACSRLIRDKFEFRDVDTQETIDWHEGTSTTVRLDTGEIIESRKLMKSEMQARLDFEKTQQKEIEEEAAVAEGEVLDEDFPVEGE